MWAMGSAPQSGSSTITVTFGTTSVSGENGNIEMSIDGADAELNAFTISVAGAYSQPSGEDFLAVEGATFNSGTPADNCNGGPG